jgi:hypothetical protein
MSGTPDSFSRDNEHDREQRDNHRQTPKNLHPHTQRSGLSSKLLGERQGGAGEASNAAYASLWPAKPMTKRSAQSSPRRSQTSHHSSSRATRFADLLSRRHWRKLGLDDFEFIADRMKVAAHLIGLLRCSSVFVWHTLVSQRALARWLTYQAVWKPRRGRQAPKWSVLNLPGLGGKCPKLHQDASTPLRSFSPARKHRRLALSISLRIRSPLGHQHAPNLRLLGVQSRPSSCVPSGRGHAGRPFRKRGKRLVYGGAAVGLMATVGRRRANAGGEVIGVIAQSLVKREVAHTGLNDFESSDRHTSAGRLWPSARIPSSRCPAASPLWSASSRARSFHPLKVGKRAPAPLWRAAACTPETPSTAGPLCRKSVRALRD